MINYEGDLLSGARWPQNPARSKTTELRSSHEVRLELRFCSVSKRYNRFFSSICVYLKENQAVCHHLLIGTLRWEISASLRDTILEQLIKVPLEKFGEFGDC